MVRGGGASEFEGPLLCTGLLPHCLLQQCRADCTARPRSPACFGLAAPARLAMAPICFFAAPLLQAAGWAEPCHAAGDMSQNCGPTCRAAVAADSVGRDCFYNFLANPFFGTPPPRRTTVDAFYSECTAPAPPPPPPPSAAAPTVSASWLPAACCSSQQLPGPGAVHFFSRDAHCGMHMSAMRGAQA